MSTLAKLESDKLPKEGAKVYYLPVLKMEAAHVEIVGYSTAMFGLPWRRRLERVATVEFLHKYGIHQAGDHHTVRLNRLYIAPPEIPVEVTTV